MATFFAIILVLLFFNIALLIFSTNNSKAKISKLTDKMSGQAPSKIYPLDLGTSKFKKAI